MEREPNDNHFIVPEDGEPKEEKEIDIEAATEEELKTRLEGLRAEIELFENTDRAKSEAAEDAAKDIEMELERRKK